MCARSLASNAFGRCIVVPCTRSFAILSHHSIPCLFISASSLNRTVGHRLRRTYLTPFLDLSLRLSTVRPAQPHLEADTQRKVQHPAVPLGTTRMTSLPSLVNMKLLFLRNGFEPQPTARGPCCLTGQR